MHLYQTDTLAKEEIVKADEHQRLKERENIDAEQIEMTKSLTQMKGSRSTTRTTNRWIRSRASGSMILQLVSADLSKYQQ